MRFQTEVSVAPASPGQPALVTALAVPRIELHTSKVSKYLDVAFRNAALICSVSILAVMALFFYELASRSRLSIVRFGFGFFVGNT